MPSVPLGIQTIKRMQTNKQQIAPLLLTLVMTNGIFVSSIWSRVSAGLQMDLEINLNKLVPFMILTAYPMFFAFKYCFAKDVSKYGHLKEKYLASMYLMMYTLGIYFMATSIKCYPEDTFKMFKCYHNTGRATEPSGFLIFQFVGGIVYATAGTLLIIVLYVNELHEDELFEDSQKSKRNSWERYVSVVQNQV
jgi:hypothetical protein